MTRPRTRVTSSYYNDILAVSDARFVIETNDVFAKLKLPTNHPRQLLAFYCCMNQTSHRSCPSKFRVTSALEPQLCSAHLPPLYLHKQSPFDEVDFCNGFRAIFHGRDRPEYGARERDGLARSRGVLCRTNSLHLILILAPVRYPDCTTKHLVFQPRTK